MEEHERIKELLDALFVGDVPMGTEWMKVRAHLCACPTCAGYFDELATLDRTLLGQHDAGEGEELFERRFGAAVMAERIDGLVHPGAGLTWWARALAWLGQLERESWAGVGALAAVAVIVGTWAWWPSLVPEPPAETLQARSAAAAPGVHRFEAFCVRRTADGPRFAAADSGVLRCDLGDELKFAVLNASAQRGAPLPWLALAARSDAGQVIVYQPIDAPAGKASMPIPSTERMTPFGETLRLSVKHQPGRYRIFGVFSAVPLDAETLEVTLASKPHAADATLNLDGLVAHDAHGRPVTLGQGTDGAWVLATQVIELTDAQSHGGTR